MSKHGMQGAWADILKSAKNETGLRALGAILFVVAGAASFGSGMEDMQRAPSFLPFSLLLLSLSSLAGAAWLAGRQ